MVTVEESQTIDSAVDVTEGISFDKGYLSPYFATEEETYHAVLDDAAVLLVRNKISSLPDFLPLLEKIAETNRPTLIIAEDVEGEPLQALVVNSIRKVLKVAAVKAPYFGERRRDSWMTWPSLPAPPSSTQRWASTSTRLASTCWVLPAA